MLGVQRAVSWARMFIRGFDPKMERSSRMVSCTNSTSSTKHEGFPHLVKSTGG